MNDPSQFVHKTIEDTKAEVSGAEILADGCEKLELYTMPTCGHCTKLKSWLTAEGIPFQDYNIIENREAHIKFSQKYQMNKVPFITCGKKTWTGFKEEYKQQFKDAVKK